MLRSEGRTMPTTRSTGRATRAGQPASGESPAEAPAPEESPTGTQASLEAPVPPGARRVAGSFARGIRPHLGLLVSIAAAVLTLAGAIALGPMDRTNAILVGFGFDPDRAQLITALIFGGITAILAYLSGAVRWAAVGLGFSVAAALFGSTFALETENALAASGATGAFDALGWTQTLLALVVIGLLTAWVCATCARPVRRELGATIAAVVDVARRRSVSRGSWERAIATFLVIGLLAATLPAAGALFNYGADALMVAGGPPRQGLVPDVQGLPGGDIPPLPLPSSSPVAAPSISSSPSASPTPTATPTLTPTATSVPAPWKSSPPSGQGRMQYLAFTGPWSGAGSTTVEVAVYLPPGYDTSGSKLYPAIYEAPFYFNLWNSGMHVKATLDGLINEGQIPPSLFIFMSAYGGPYVDTQCADTYDGVEKVDRFMGTTVPTYIDKHYRTIAKASARAVMGMSEGGYCAAILSLHHPDVFGSEISFSGYFTAGLSSASAKYPFGNNPALINNDSPIYLVPRLDPDVMPGLYAVLVAQRIQDFYGSQAEDYQRALVAAGIKQDFIETSQPHGWAQVRDTFAQALTLVAERQAELGVFD